MTDKTVVCALDYSWCFTGLEALLTPVMLALKSHVKSKGKELSFPSDKGIKTPCKQHDSDSASDRGLGAGDLWRDYFPCLFVIL